jgi:isoleucyl-tRNA synthetase
MLQGNYQVLAELKGSAMEGWRYRGPFDDLPAAQKIGGQLGASGAARMGPQTVTSSPSQAHRVILWEEVGETEGTGIVHIAPGCGAEDFVLGKQYHLPLIAPLEEEGHFVDGFGWLSGMHVSEVAEPIFGDLERKNLLYHVAPYTHRYPTCWRCATELVFRLVDEWFISMGEVYDKPRQTLTPAEKSRSLRYQIMDVVDQTRFIPEFGNAREMDWLYNMHDWMISKKRFWGLALPIWVCSQCDHFEVIGDERELAARAIAGWEEFEGHSPHRPFVDQVKIACPRCQGRMDRIRDVGNPWLDAGIVPFSTLRYRADPEYWRTWYPAHWICESFPGQFRNWFYSLLAMATVLDQSPPFLENFTYATVLDEEGRPMHKSWGNAIEFNEAADKMGVDVMRWLYCTQKPEHDLLFGYNRGDEVRRGFLIPLWNVYSFFVTYANLDGWSPDESKADHGFDPRTPEGATPSSENLLDRWILTRLNQVVGTVTQKLEDSDPLSATIAVESLLDDLSNWFVRRSRRRFWKSEHDRDKHAAYATLYHVLVKFTQLLAPFIPFVTETIYQNLVRSVYPQAYHSIHHCTWPAADEAALDDALLEQMALARQVASLGLSARNSVGLKVRQPLAKVLVDVPGKRALDPGFVEIVTDELNVKTLEFVAGAGQLVSYRILPNNQLLGPRFGARFPKVRAALERLDANEAAAHIKAGETIHIDVGGDLIELSPDEVLLETEPLEGLAVAADRGITVAVDAVITPALRAEGLAREIVRRVQAMRKAAGFNIQDRITTYIHGEGEDLDPILADWAPYIKAETLTASLAAGEPPQDAYVEQHELDGMQLLMGVKRN